MLRVGEKAPDFTLKNQNGEDITLSSFLGKRVVLYFYPKDNTSGCTIQAQSFNNLIEEFHLKSAIVIGISKDSIKSHVNFVDRYDLKINLLSDPDLTTIKKYDVWHEKSMYGKKYFGVIRTTYIIDKDGIITSAEEKVSPNKNALETLAKL